MRGRPRFDRLENKFLAPEAREVLPGSPPTFSVIVAAHQVADVIGDALESVRNQTLAPLEVIVFGLAAVRRSRVVDHEGFDESILWTTDWDLWLRLILDGSRAGCIDEPLAVYRLRETSLTARRRDLLLGKLATLEKARRNPDLLPADKPTLESSLDAYRRELDLMDPRVAAAAGLSGAPPRALEVLRARGYAARSRLQIAAIAAAPGAAGRILGRRADTAWTGAAGIRVPLKPRRRWTSSSSIA